MIAAVGALLADQPPWYVLGPVTGLVLVSLFALINARMGVLGGVTDIVDRVSGRSTTLGWKGWFVVGITLGALAFQLAAGEGASAGYGWLSRAGASDGAVAAILVFAGVLIGYGAKYAGGCTSGNGLSGVSFGSKASLVAMATFMGTAIVASFVIEAFV